MDLFQFIWERTWFTNQGVFSRRGVYVVLCWLEIKRFDMQRVKEVEIV